MTPHDGIWHDEVPALIFNSKQSRTVLLKLSSAVEVVRSLIFGAERIISEIQLKAGELHWGSKLEIPQLLESSSNPNKFLTPPFSQYLNKPLVHSQLQLNLNFWTGVSQSSFVHVQLYLGLPWKEKSTQIFFFYKYDYERKFSLIENPC